MPRAIAPWTDRPAAAMPAAKGSIASFRVDSGFTNGRVLSVGYRFPAASNVVFVTIKRVSCFAPNRCTRRHQKVPWLPQPQLRYPATGNSQPTGRGGPQEPPSGSPGGACIDRWGTRACAGQLGRSEASQYDSGRPCRLRTNTHDVLDSELARVGCLPLYTVFKAVCTQMAPIVRCGAFWRLDVFFLSVPLDALRMLLRRRGRDLPRVPRDLPRSPEAGRTALVW